MAMGGEWGEARGKEMHAGNPPTTSRPGRDAKPAVHSKMGGAVYAPSRTAQKLPEKESRRRPPDASRGDFTEGGEEE